ncbi:MAG: hypothetical protein ACXQT4_00290 [Methanotrichaceae archaeon]
MNFLYWRCDRSLMEIWQIGVICVLMLPMFFLANYIVVKSIIKSKAEREERIERAIAATVARDMNPENRFKKKRRRRF